MIIGHERQLNYLEGLIKTGRVPHAFVFHGPAFIGKKLIALAFFWKMIKTRLHEQVDKNWKDFFNDENLLFFKGEHPDIFFLSKDPSKKETGIDQVRKLRRFVELSPFQLSKKLVLIDNAHELSKEAFNSLLKTLEEPARDTIIILVSSKLSELPKTVTSRSVLLSFQTVSMELLLSGLKKQKLNIDKKDLAWIDGRVGLALLLSEDPENELIKTFREHFSMFLDLAKKKSIIDNMSLAQKIATNPMLDHILEIWILALRHAMKESPGQETSLLLSIKKIATTKELLVKTNVNKRLQLENVLISICL